ncbi:uncharacterized protein MYCFIDRAFT_179973 [Pseudocercospora fijiensis CIRAD86]|uniref:Uncharacterized protein n=1 Tax=Pseudocercospora fijiensis (strain CIRAD86) TaxID=383855 RepID=M2ZZ28_PSEFD|nr:uncharacterized protein MYCFIDRAFT_179973 [Pseudocercospora fijiensis CIRAD86]EME77401.1 hypothetical protein MYCFIDRAFT_179973 [Pseudocercospora fijiensis CIRAD86]
MEVFLQAGRCQNPDLIIELAVFDGTKPCVDATEILGFQKRGGDKKAVSAENSPLAEVQIYTWHTHTHTHTGTEYCVRRGVRG